MRTAILTLSLALALPLIPAAAHASSHNCAQLRNLVRVSVPNTIRNLPYYALDCAAISEIHLLINSYRNNQNTLRQRIEAVFRREGLIQ